jgi:hypothetical protein
MDGKEYLVPDGDVARLVTSATRWRQVTPQ